MKENAKILPPVVTIDGPSGSGKGTVSLQLALSLGWHFLDSGAIYRAFAFIAQQQGADLHDENSLLPLIDTLSELTFTSASHSHQQKILWGNQDITESIRTESFGKLASMIGTYAPIRAALLDYQRAFRKMPGLVADGRDMGTVVFPQAQLKVFLQATLQERAKRRYLQLKQRGKHVSLEAIQTALKQRDMQDEQRTIAPLKAAKDALIIDTTHLSVKNIVQRLITCLAEKGVILNNDRIN